MSSEASSSGASSAMWCPLAMGPPRRSAVVGDDEPVALLDRPEMQAALHASSGSEILTAFAEISSRILIRAAPLLATLLVGARAGEHELREIALRAGEQRLADFTRVIEAVAATGDLHPDLDIAHAADILWTIGSPEAYLQLTVDRGWDPDDYQRWLTHALHALLLRGDHS
jgi:hypothetical protein